MSMKANLKRALLELHDDRVVDASALGEDQDGHLLRVLDVFPQPPRHLESVLGLRSLEPDVSCSSGQTFLKSLN